MLSDCIKRSFQVAPQSLPLCLNTLILAPESLAPKMRDVWLSSSLIIKDPLPTMVGILPAFVANPIPNTTAAGFPTNRATRASSFWWIERVPVVREC